MHTQSAQNSHVAGSKAGQLVPSWTHALMLHVSKLLVCPFAELRVRELPCQHWPHRGSNYYRQIENKQLYKMCISIICFSAISGNTSHVGHHLGAKRLNSLALAQAKSTVGFVRKQ